MKNTLIDWLGTFWKVLTAPTPQTFLMEAKKADGKFASAMGWLVFLGIYLYAVASIAVNRAPLSAPILLTFTLGIPLAVILATSTAYALCRRVFRRKEYLYDKMLYTVVAVLFSIFFTFSPLSIFIPESIFAFVSFILFFYLVALVTIAMKTIVNIEYWQALVIVFLSMVTAILSGIITIVLIQATVSPAGTINSVNNTITTPGK